MSRFQTLGFSATAWISRTPRPTRPIRASSGRKPALGETCSASSVCITQAYRSPVLGLPSLWSNRGSRKPAHKDVSYSMFRMSATYAVHPGTEPSASLQVNRLQRAEPKPAKTMHQLWRRESLQPHKGRGRWHEETYTREK